MMVTGPQELTGMNPALKSIMFTALSHPMRTKFRKPMYDLPLNIISAFKCSEVSYNNISRLNAYQKMRSDSQMHVAA